MSSPDSEIKNVWRIVAVDAGSVLELRALWPKGIPGKQSPMTRHFRAVDYATIDDLRAAFETSALALNARGYNVYTVMNPIRSDFAGPNCATDDDIRYRDLLLVDVDRVGDTSCPADQTELDAARGLTAQIRTYMSERGWPHPITLMSGNGYHLYYILDALTNNDDSAALVHSTLRNLANAFNNDVVGIDTTVANASRITKVPGTVMRKGLPTAERPYRMAEVCDE